MRSIGRLVSVFLAIVVMVTNCSVDITVSAENESFTITYYENDEKFNAGTATGRGTVVTYGTATKTQTIQQLGFEQVGRVFVQWKVHRSRDDIWRVVHRSTMAIEWVELTNGGLPEGYSFSKLGSGAVVSDLVQSGEVQFVALWDTTGNPITFYDSEGGSALSKTFTLKYNVPAAIPTAKELGLSKDKKVFAGWKAQRDNQKDWRIKNSAGASSWASSLADGDEYFIYSDGITLAGFYESGKLNFYAQWIDTDFDVVKDFGANGNDKADDSAAIQKALDMARNTDQKITVRVPAGNYYIANTLYIYSNTELVLDAKATITCLGETRLMILNLSKSDTPEGGYGRSENITVRGGKWDGNGQAGDKHNDLVLITHAQNVTIKDATFVNCCGNHFIEFAGVKDSLVENCTFKDHVQFNGVNYDQNSNEQTVNQNGPTAVSEAIQLDYAADKNTEGAASPFDGTVCKDVTITKCTFDNCLTGIGNHYDDDTGTGYHFTNNTFTNIKRNCFNLFAFGGLEISGNTANNVGRFINAYKSIPPKQAETLIRSNTINNTSAQYKNLSDSILSNESQGLTISDNKISGFQNGMVLNKSSNLKVLRNTVSGVKEDGIKVVDTKNCDIKGNDISNCGLYNIATYNDCSGTIADNKYDISYGIFNTGNMTRGTNQYKDLAKEPDYFTIYYHKNDTAPSSSVTTTVKVGTTTAYKTLEELGFYTSGKKFTGWKIYRKDIDCWLVKNANGNQSWEKTVPKGGSYVLYSDKNSVASTAAAGGEVHFYAQWVNCDYFTIYYHSNDTALPNANTTNVKVGTPTKYLTREQLRYWINGKEFLGWKVYRADTQCWYVKDANGKTSWAKSVPSGGSYELYANEGTVSNTANAGAEVHFYAQWKDTDSFTILYHQDDNASKSALKTSVKYGTSTKYLTIDQLGFKPAGKKFVGWKLYRSDSLKWYVQNKNGSSSWQESVPKGGSYSLYPDGGSVAKTDVPGGEVHFYAVWETVPTAASPVRIAGTNRFSTATAISAKSFEKADTVVLAYGLNYADALAGVTLANKLKAPILLTHTAKLPDETLAEIKRLGAKKAIILGGTGAISKNVEDTLKKNGLTTERYAGTTRFGTATAIAEKLNDKPTDIFFVYAFNYADALSVSTVAALKNAPIIYLRTSGELDKDTADYLAKLKKAGSVKNAYVIGGAGVISDAMMKKAGDALGVKPTRIAGKNRYATCVEVNTKFKDTLTGNAICVAKGLDFPDALAGGVFAALNKAPLFLADNALKDEQIAYLKSKKAAAVYVFGGTGAVSDKLAKEIYASR